VQCLLIHVPVFEHSVKVGHRLRATYSVDTASLNNKELRLVLYRMLPNNAVSTTAKATFA
jgi:hypothetical protein